jgi:3-phenylpropionate/trans-cinnamate dioxygenase ferredoxin subunit
MSDWIDIAPAAEFGPGEARLVETDDARIAVFNLDGDYFAMEDVCSHDSSPLLGCGLAPADLVDGDRIMCPRHGARFCIRTGEALTPPAYEPVATFPVRIHNGIVQLKKPPLN